jgi:hypothetical protein
MAVKPSAAVKGPQGGQAAVRCSGRGRSTTMGLLCTGGRVP